MATAPTPHKTALITGAFSGAVMALANHVAQDGYQLVFATRSVTKNFQKD